MEFSFLIRSEAIRMFTQSSEEAIVFGDLGSDLSEELHEVMLNDADDMEAVGNDFSIGEVTFDESAVRGTQIDADNAHFIPAVQGLQEAFELTGALALGDIKDAVVAQIAEGGGETAALVKSMFVDTEELGAES